MKARTPDGDNKSEERKKEPLTIAEWVSLCVSILIILSLIGLSVYAHTRGSDKPASVHLTFYANAARFENGHYHLPLDVINTGGNTAEDVQVEVALQTAGNAQPETATVIIPFLAANEVVHATIALESDPRKGKLSYTAGYVLP